MTTDGPSVAIERLASLLRRSGDELLFAESDLDLFRDATLETISGSALLLFVGELLDFAAFLEVKRDAPRAAALLFGLLIMPLTEALDAQARASGDGSDAIESLTDRVRSAHDGLKSRRGTLDGLAPTRSGVGLRSGPRKSKNTSKKGK